jgi:hypothetical protein
MDEIIEKIYSKMTKNDLLLITGDHGMVDHPMLKHMSPSGVATGGGGGRGCNAPSVKISWLRH